MKGSSPPCTNQPTRPRSGCLFLVHGNIVVPSTEYWKYT